MKIDNFFAELKRRNVIRMAGLYLAGQPNTLNRNRGALLRLAGAGALMAAAMRGSEQPVER